MAKSERIYVDLATIGKTPSKKAGKSGPGMVKSKARKGSKGKLKNDAKSKNPTNVKPGSGKQGKK